MNLLLRRFQKNNNYQYGLLSAIGREDDMKFTIENGFNQKFIEVGTYEIKFREVLSGLTRHYRSKFDWFTFHLELQNVINAKYVYIHIGNDEGDTDACICIANVCDLTPPTIQGFVGESTQAYKEFYLKVSDRLNKGEKVFITILNI